MCKYCQKTYLFFLFDRTTNLKFGYRLLNDDVLTLDDLTGDFYLAAVSQGGYLFKDLDTLKQLLKDNHLEEEISGITNYKDYCVIELNETKTKMIITIVTIIINVFILLIATVFETINILAGIKSNYSKKNSWLFIISSNVRLFNNFYLTFYYVSLHYAYFIWFKDIIKFNNVYCYYYSTFTSNCLY